MAKVNFSARKDPLLRNPRRQNTPGLNAPRRTDDHASASLPKPATVAVVRASEGPAGVVAVDPPEFEHAPPAAQAQPANEAPPANEAKRAVETTPTDDQQARAQPRRRARRAEGRVQTSVSLPPDVWDTLDELAADASDSTGRLLIAILAAAIPDTPTAAFTTVEHLLLGRSPDDALHEERNYRLPIDLRTRLDELAAALGDGARRQRSLLIRAILTAHSPADSTQARDLLTSRRLERLRPAESTAA